MLLWNGIRVYELQSSTLHSKTVTIDGVYTSIGSFNFDRLSSFSNLEVNLSIFDPRVAQTIEIQFFSDLQNAKEIKISELENRTFPQKLFHRISYWATRAFVWESRHE